MVEVPFKNVLISILDSVIQIGCKVNVRMIARDNIRLLADSPSL